MSCDVEGAQDCETATLWGSVLAVYENGVKTEAVIASHTQGAGVGRTLKA